MRTANLRAGAYALLAVSLINAVYRNGDTAVRAVAFTCAALAAGLLVATTFPAGNRWLRHPLASGMAWLLIAAGLAVNLLG